MNLTFHNLWIGIFPQFVYDKPKVLDRYLPSNLNSLAYRMPSDTVIEDPRKIRKVITNVYEDARSEIERSSFPAEKINIIGASIGGLPDRQHL